MLANKNDIKVLASRRMQSGTRLAQRGRACRSSPIAGAEIAGGELGLGGPERLPVQNLPPPGAAKVLASKRSIKVLANKNRIMSAGGAHLHVGPAI